MNKKNGVKKLGKPAGERNAMIRSQVKDLIQRGHIKTTKARGKQVIRKFDQLIGMILAKNNKLVSEYLSDSKAEEQILKLNLGERKTGFATMIEIKNRAGDNAERVLIELIKA
jgi:ribosomal protein L17